MANPQRNTEFTTRLLPDGYILIHSDKATWVHTLTPLGGLIWELCDGENSPESMVEIIRSQTQIDVDQQQVLQLLSELEKNGLLAASAAEPAAAR